MCDYGGTGGGRSRGDKWRMPAGQGAGEGAELHPTGKSSILFIYLLNVGLTQSPAISEIYHHLVCIWCAFDVHLRH
jgi:uncharacterized spore protein YtfJ